MKRFTICLLALALFAGALYAGPLHEAAKKGDIGKVKQLLKQGHNVNARNKEGLTLTPLHMAAALGKTHIAEFLISKGANVNANSKGLIPLHLAARAGHTDIVKLLISKGAKVNARANYKGYTPLGYAMAAGYTETAELLRKHGGRDIGKIQAEREKRKLSAEKICIDSEPTEPTEPDTSRDSVKKCYCRIAGFECSHRDEAEAYQLRYIHKISGGHTTRDYCISVRDDLKNRDRNYKRDMMNYKIKYKRHDKNCEKANRYLRSYEEKHRDILEHVDTWNSLYN